jgi:DNA-directed RNA polymerase subunit M/transcription elongation factor TFIIS
MNTLKPISLECRDAWIQHLANILEKRQVKNAACVARVLEHEAHIRRAQQREVHGVTLTVYGDTVVLPMESQEKHMACAASEYTRLMQRAAFICSDASVETLHSLPPAALLGTSDDTLTVGTAHAAWQDNFYQLQELARTVLSSDKSNAQQGIFACPKCKSYDVDVDQKQTRSADEPMTIFCSCNVCGKRFIR